MPSYCWAFPIFVYGSLDYVKEIYLPPWVLFPLTTRHIFAEHAGPNRE